MVRMDSAQVRSVSAVPNEIERLTQVTFLADLAYGKLRSREVEERLECPGLRVVSPYGQRLQVNDVITEIEEPTCGQSISTGAFTQVPSAPAISRSFDRINSSRSPWNRVTCPLPVQRDD